ncbi:hypothetical protein SAMN02745121_05713 [Nannocystis exedens]|uniref:Uncharacterized protein n=1 Tax=Nannocystis exedens TaxID=54 RepID=A0A1I2DS04_9BACT|nr:hypothetical protein [Nannocystis exedens]PCC68954.1 hypothetical protein NAEX_01975 [Nannocystis exedens]SFE83189.1 hypothetical protein SAMN02745121_05713 [Nannocystis exedens]
MGPAHLLVAGRGAVPPRCPHQQSESVIEPGARGAGLGQDAFTGLVYASMSSLEVLAIEPFTGIFEVFATMPDQGRVAVARAASSTACPPSPCSRRRA